MRLDRDSSDIFDQAKSRALPETCPLLPACGETGARLTVDVPRSRPLLGRATESDRRTRRSITRPLTHPPRGRKICPPAPSALRSEFLPCWEPPVVPSLCSYSALYSAGKRPLQFSVQLRYHFSVVSVIAGPLFSFQCSCNLISSRCSLSFYSDSWNLQQRGL